MSQGTVTNKIFIGCPSEGIKATYEKITEDLKTEFPLYFFLMDQPLHRVRSELYPQIKQNIENSSWAIFDATSNNANVSLEFGYADGAGIEQTLFYNDSEWTKKKSEKKGAVGSIMADLAGSTRNHYKNSTVLKKKLIQFCNTHPFTERFTKAINEIGRKKKKKLDGRNIRRFKGLGLKIIHFLSGKDIVRREALKSKMLAETYSLDEFETVMRALKTNNVIFSEQGPHSRVSIK